jgi:hypothetical protein
MRRLVHDLSAASENPKELGAVFSAMWPQLEAAVTQAINAVPPDTEPRRSADDMLEELVDRMRRMDRQLNKEAGDPYALVVFTKNYVKHALGSKTTFMQGTSALVTHVHTDPSGEITRLDVRLPDGKFIPDVPDYFTAEGRLAPVPGEPMQS